MAHLVDFRDVNSSRLCGCLKEQVGTKVNRDVVFRLADANAGATVSRSLLECRIALALELEASGNKTAQKAALLQAFNACARGSQYRN